MSAPRPRFVRRALLAACVLAACAAPARASGPAPEPEPAPPDTTLHRFLGTLSDSTDRYFGMSAAPLDTAGLDTLVSFPSERYHRGRPGLLPSFDFSRVDGSTFGGGLRLARPGMASRLDLKAAYAVGSETWLGGAELHRRVRRHGVMWTLDGWGGRETAALNRDHFEPFFDPSRALATGSDRAHYVRHDGWRASFERESDLWRAGLAVRDMLESPLPVTARWDLFHRRLVVPGNLPATLGRAREIQLSAGARLPVVPLRAQADYWTSGPGLGSDFVYDRVRLAMGGDFAVGRWASLVPQAAWGFVNGAPTPQQSFYLGAGPTLASIPRDALGGSSFGIAKLEVVSVRDLLGLLGVPRPELLYFQPAAFAAAGAVGGVDPFGGPKRPRWPVRTYGHSEAGVALHYSPGLFGVTMRFSEAWPIGPTRRGERFEFLLSHPLDLLRKPLEE